MLPRSWKNAFWWMEISILYACHEYPTLLKETDVQNVYFMVICYGTAFYRIVGPLLLLRFFSFALLNFAVFAKLNRPKTKNYTMLKNCPQCTFFSNERSLNIFHQKRGGGGGGAHSSKYGIYIIYFIGFYFIFICTYFHYFDKRVTIYV